MYIILFFFSKHIWGALYRGDTIRALDANATNTVREANSAIALANSINDNPSVSFRIRKGNV